MTMIVSESSGLGAPRVTRIWTDARVATMTPGATPYGVIENGAVAAFAGRIVWVGPKGDMPRFDADEVVDCEGRWITPGLIDCHTHLVFAGDRSQEFEARLRGASYKAIAQAGGGIMSTVRAVRAADEEELAALAWPRLARLTAEGVTTVEIKSGYGLDVENEAKMLRVARRLGEFATVKTTFLGAHALPTEHADRKDYVDLVCGPMLDAVADLADAVDAFCEGLAFTPEETRRIFAAAQAKGLRVKLHADQFSNSGGAALAAEFKALSADHLEYTGESGVAAMAEAGTVATLLPGAYHYLRETQAPPVDALRRAGVPIAVASDFNPGSSPINSLLTAMSLACVLFKLTPEEALAGVTRNAALALGLESEAGTIEAGKWCDLAIWNVESPGELAYWMGVNPLHARVWRGK